MFKQWKLNFQIRFAKNKAKTLELPRLVNLLFYEINHRRYRYQVEGITKKQIEEEAMFIPQSIRSVTEISSTSPKNALPKEAMFLENKYIGAVRFLNNNNNYILALAQEDLSESKETHLFFNNKLVFSCRRIVGGFFVKDEIDAFIDGKWVNDIKKLALEAEELQMKRNKFFNRKNRNLEINKIKKNFGI